MPSLDISIGNYLLLRLKELGCHTIFGVPGDFNMGFLDVIEDDPEMTWGANTDELIAGYAADGYARVKGIGALCTTFGVGELSAINAIAGSYSEMIPIVNIVGTPSTHSQKGNKILHHTLGNGDFEVFLRAHEGVTVAQANITVENAIKEIDRVLELCFYHKRPVYIALPVNLSHHKIHVDNFIPLSRAPIENNKVAEEEAVKHILYALDDNKVGVIIDGFAGRFHVEDEVRNFIEQSGLPVYNAPMGKSIIDEFHPQYRGSSGNQRCRDELNNMDVVLAIGSIKSDFNTGDFERSIDQNKLIELYPSYVKVFNAVYNNVGFKGVLDKLITNVKKRPISLPPLPATTSVSLPKDSIIEQKWFWEYMGELLGRRPHVIVAETGTSSFGIGGQRISNGSRYIAQTLWGSIGYATGAALGSAVGEKEKPKPLRTILFTGDGSFQLTATSLSSMMRHGVTPIIVIINNDGYTIEKAIHGWERDYNHIEMWKYSKSLEYFTVNPESKSHYPKIGLQAQLKTFGDVSNAFNIAFEETDKIHILEVVMESTDVPEALQVVAKLTAEENHYHEGA